VKLHYHPDGDMLYVRLREGAYVESEEVAPGVVLDFDAEGRVLGIELEEASTRVDLARLDVAGVALDALTIQAGAEEAVKD
jgi:uncharacterized protein YuzE